MEVQTWLDTALNTSEKKNLGARGVLILHGVCQALQEVDHFLMKLLLPVFDSVQEIEENAQRAEALLSQLKVHLQAAQER